MAEILRAERPGMIFFPQVDDFNSTYLGTHLLVMDALQTHFPTEERPVILVETEYWHQLSDPNLLVGLAKSVLALLPGCDIYRMFL
jgi:hypothetical protein